MPKKIEYELCKEFESFAELNAWKISRKATWSIKNSVRSRCTSYIAATHDKRIAYAYCKAYAYALRRGRPPKASLALQYDDEKRKAKKKRTKKH